MVLTQTRQGWASIPQHCPNAVGAAHFHLNLHHYSTLPKNIPRTGLQNRRSLGFARDDKGERITSMRIRWMVGRTACPFCPSVGMTIQNFGRNASAQEKLASSS